MTASRSLVSSNAAVPLKSRHSQTFVLPVKPLLLALAAVAISPTASAFGFTFLPSHRKISSCRHLSNMMSDDEYVKVYEYFKSLNDAESHPTNNSTAEAYQNVMDVVQSKLTERDIRTILSLGLVTCDPTKTSPALKYIACEGHLLNALPGDRKRFEDLVATHLCRYYECLDFTVSFHTLKSQFPPPRQTQNSVKDDNAPFDEIRQEMKRCEVLVILQPREFNAAGPDIMVLDMTVKNNYQLDLYKVKHLKDPSCFDTDKVQTNLFCVPACRENAEALEKALHAKIRNRFLQLSSQAKDSNTPKHNIDGVCVLSREFLQPSWDAFQVGDGWLVTKD